MGRPGSALTLRTARWRQKAGRPARGPRPAPRPRERRAGPGPPGAPPEPPEEAARAPRTPAAPPGIARPARAAGSGQRGAGPAARKEPLETPCGSERTEPAAPARQDLGLRQRGRRAAGSGQRLRVGRRARSRAGAASTAPREERGLEPTPSLGQRLGSQPLCLPESLGGPLLFGALSRGPRLPSLARLCQQPPRAPARSPPAPRAPRGPGPGKRGEEGTRPGSARTRRAPPRACRGPRHQAPDAAGTREVPARPQLPIPDVTSAGATRSRGARGWTGSSWVCGGTLSAPPGRAGPQTAAPLPRALPREPGGSGSSWGARCAAAGPAPLAPGVRGRPASSPVQTRQSYSGRGSALPAGPGLGSAPCPRPPPRPRPSPRRPRGPRAPETPAALPGTPPLGAGSGPSASPRPTSPPPGPRGRTNGEWTTDARPQRRPGPRAPPAAPGKVPARPRPGPRRSW